MVLTSKSSDFQPKKEKKRKRIAGKGKDKPETTVKNKRETTPPEPPPNIDNTMPTTDSLPKNLLLQKSKTLMDFRRKSKPEMIDSQRFDWNQLSFRKRINHFIQNSPLLRRANHLKHTPSLRSDLNRLSDSLESLKIDENRIMNSFRGPPPPNSPLQAQSTLQMPSSTFAPLLEDNKSISKSFRSKSCNEFELRKRSLGSSPVCSKCSESDKVMAFGKSGSLLNLSDKSIVGKFGSMKRSASVQLTARPWTWILGTVGYHSKVNLGRQKTDSDDFCSHCGLPMYLLREPAISSSRIFPSFRQEKPLRNSTDDDGFSKTEDENKMVRSRSLTHIDQIEQGQRSGIFFQDMYSTEKSGEQLAVPTSTTGKHRRQMLSRSEANSSECFSVGIEGGGDDDGNDEFVPASKDTILRDALLDICKRRGIDLTSSNVFLDANKSPLPCLDIDTSWMGGKHIRIKVNDRVTAVKKDQKNSFAPPMKKKSSNYKGVKSGSRTHNVSSEEPSLMEPGPSGKSKRWSGFFGTSRDTSKMETLVDLLDSYTKNGIYEYKEDMYKLEPDWKTIVSNSVNLEEKQSQQQEAIWELIRSEIDYIKMLRVVSHLFIACLVNLQSNQLLLEIDNKKLFGNVEEIYSCNDSFWRKHLSAVVETSRKTGEPLNPDLLKEGFMEFPTVFKCYETYCTQQSKCQMYCREKLQQEQDNELFTAYLAWCETQKECNRLKLLDILVKPMQRLTKYSLLLKAIMKHTVNPSQRDNLSSMIKSVDHFVNNVNSTLKQNQDLETMRQLMSKIESYDVIESKDEDLANLIQKYSSLNLTHDIPGTTHKRSLLFESDVKYKDAATSSKIEVRAFLFTDFLLITKPVKRLGESKVKFKIIRQPFAIEQLVTQEINRDPPLLACVYLSVYRTACSAFMLSCSETELIKNWSEAIKKAKSLCASLKSQDSGGVVAQTPTAPPISRQPSGFANEDASIGDNIEDGKTMTYNLGLWAGRSPRGSSYGSRISSLVHSHSGSMEMTENMSSISSVSASRGVSVENNSEVRGSSLSSDDGNTNLAPSPRVELTTSPRIEKKDAQPSAEKRESPVLHRPESKSFYRKSITKTKNTLTIQVPHLGQSLPNLNIASSAGGGTSPTPCPPNSLLLAPPKSHGGLLSPSQRGVSYPPPSPPRGSLKRGFAISPKNPLVKTANVSMELSRSVSVTQPSDSEKQPEEKKTIGLQTNLDGDSKSSERKSDEGKCSQCKCSSRPSIVGKPNGKKLVRSQKSYNTTGPTEDVKGKKDPVAGKRPSLNSGNESTEPLGLFNKHLSVGSVQSSSGFSSAGSSVEGLLTKEDGGTSKGFRFEEILHMINLENGDGNNDSEGQTDVERFDSKVSKWQKYGFDDGGTREPDKTAEDAFARTKRSCSPFGSAATPGSNGFSAEKRHKTPHQVFTRKRFDDLECKRNLTPLINALQLENFFRLTGKWHKSNGVTGKKRKRRSTL